MRRASSHRPMSWVPVLAILLLAACASTRDSGGRRPEVVFPPSTKAGDRLLHGLLIVEDVRIPRGKGEAAEFRLRNVSGRDLPSLTADIQFFYDPPAGGLAKMASVGSSQVINIAAGRVVELKAVYRNHSPLRALVLNVGVRPTAPGVTYFGGVLECTDVRTGIDSISFKVKNVGSLPIPGLEYSVVLVRRGTGEVIMQSDWVPMPGGTMAPGQESVLTPPFPEKRLGFPDANLMIRRKAE